MDILDSSSTNKLYFISFINSHTHDLNLKILIKKYNFSLDDLRIIAKNLCFPKPVTFTRSEYSNSESDLFP